MLSSTTGNKQVQVFHWPQYLTQNPLAPFKQRRPLQNIDEYYLVQTFCPWLADICNIIYAYIPEDNEVICVQARMHTVFLWHQENGFMFKNQIKN